METYDEMLNAIENKFRKYDLSKQSLVVIITEMFKKYLKDKDDDHSRLLIVVDVCLTFYKIEKEKGEKNDKNKK